MRQPFMGLNIALSGLYSAQKNLNIVNHNLSNASTPGYSRQKTTQVADKPFGLYDGKGMMGTGTNVTAVNRIRDEYLDLKYWSEESANGEWETKSNLLGELEIVFNEPSDNGYNKITNDFFESLHELAKDPSSDAVRAVVREKAVTLTKYFNSTAAHFQKIQTDVNNVLTAKVKEVNSLAEQISEVNRQIDVMEANGDTANDLRDQRTVLIDKLSKLVNIDTSEYKIGTNQNGTDRNRFSISISGKALLDNYDVYRLSIDMREERQNAEDVDGLYEIGWEDGNTLDIRGGQLKGYLDVRDGNAGENGSPDYKGVPYYIKKFDQYVRTLAMAINEGYIDLNNNGLVELNEDTIGHADGYKKDSAVSDNVSEVRFFTHLDDEGNNVTSVEFLDDAYDVLNDPTSTDRQKIDAIFAQYQNITATNFAVSQDLFNNYSNISVADVGGEVGNIEVLNDILSMRHNKELFSEGAPEDFMKALIGTLGIDSQQARRLSDTQSNVISHIENRRMSESGVSVDEEMADLVKYQHNYTAAAKMISTMQEVYETLINRLGV